MLVCVVKCLYDMACVTFSEHEYVWWMYVRPPPVICDGQCSGVNASDQAVDVD